MLHFLERWGNPKPAEMSVEQAVAGDAVVDDGGGVRRGDRRVHPDRNLFATIKLLTREGTRSIAIDEQERCWKEASA